MFLDVYKVYTYHIGGQYVQSWFLQVLKMCWNNVKLRRSLCPFHSDDSHVLQRHINVIIVDRSASEIVSGR